MSAGETPPAPPLPAPEGQPLGEVEDFIIKAWGRCNLGCDYCYMYEGVDKTFRERPNGMDEDTFRRFAGRLGDYVQDYSEDDKEVAVIFHGGEATLQPPEFFDMAASAIQDNMPPDRARLNIQTNGTRLSDEYLDIFAQNGITVGLSLDGDKVANDRHRLLPNGRSSYDSVREGIERINGKEAYRALFKGILSVIDLRNDPIETYEQVRQALRWGAPENVDLSELSIDFLPPLGNWTYPAPGRPNKSSSETPYADWYIKLYDHWSTEISGGARENVPQIRIFREILTRHLTNGEGAYYDIFGVEGRYPPNMIVETDGTYHLLDALKTTGPRLTDLDDLNVREHSIAQAEQKMREKAKRLGIVALPQACQDCDVKRICGGGWFPHRFEKGADPLFGNRPVYHPDWYKLINHLIES